MKINVVSDVAVSKSDPAATYNLVPPSSEKNNVPSNWASTHAEGDIPLFRIPKLAFQKEEGI